MGGWPVGWPGKVVTIQVFKDSHLTVTPDPIRVSKSKNEELIWVCSEPDADFIVSFVNDSPFAGSRFSKDKSHSGPVQALAHANRNYKYAVMVGGMTLDPVVLVDP